MIGLGFGFDLFQILFTILFVLVAVVIVVTVIRNLSQWHKNNQSPRLTVPATVVAKRVNVTHHRYDPVPHLHGLLRHLPGGKRRPDGAFAARPRIRTAGRGRQGKSLLPGHPVPGV